MINNSAAQRFVLFDYKVPTAAQQHTHMAAFARCSLAAVANTALHKYIFRKVAFFLLKLIYIANIWLRQSV